MSVHLHKRILFNPKFFPEACNLRQNDKCVKTANNANDIIFISITTFIPLWCPEVNPF